MTAVRKRPEMTVEEFIVWEELQDDRYEFLNGEITAMVGGTRNLSQIAANIDRRLAALLKGTTCRSYQAGLKVVTASSVLYPDVFVTCSRMGGKDRIVAEPVVIFEVLSDSTARRDKVYKNQEYRSLESVTQYVIVDQDFAHVDSFLRSADGWLHDAMSTPDAVLRLPRLTLELTLAEIYEDTEIFEAGEG